MFFWKLKKGPARKDPAEDPEPAAGMEKARGWKSKIHFLLFAAIILAAGSVFYRTWYPDMKEIGESSHYITSAYTLLHSGRISFTRQDIRSIEQICGIKWRIYNFPRYRASDRSLLHRWATEDARSPDFMGRSYYWGTYSALCIPAYCFCRKFHIFDSNIINAFKWTNIFMLLVPLAAIIFLLKGSAGAKYLLLGAFAFPAAAQYINWASAECCIYMFVTLCLIFLYNRQYCLSSLCLSFAATLNYCLAPLALVILFGFLRDHRADVTFKPFHVKRDFILKFLLLGCCYLPVVYAAFWTWLQYSSIATMSGAGTTTFLWERFFSYLFDWNLGILVYHPVSFVIFLFSIIVIVWKRDWELMLLWLAFFGIVLGFSFMSHIQSGMVGISRYGAWSVPVTVYTAVCTLDRYVPKLASGILVGIHAVLGCLILLFPPCRNERDLHPAAALIFDHCPKLYDPFFPIFSQRAGWEPGYVSSVPVLYKGKRKGKVLCCGSQLENFWAYFSAGDEKSFDEIERQRKLLLKKKAPYYYMNLSRTCILRYKKLSFNPDSGLFSLGSKRVGNSIVLLYGGIQFGPYINLAPGKYHVKIFGDKLDKTGFACTANAGKTKIPIYEVKISKRSAEYVVTFPKSTLKIEFVSVNSQPEPVRISRIVVTAR